MEFISGPGGPGGKSPSPSYQRGNPNGVFSVELSEQEIGDLRHLLKHERKRRPELDPLFEKFERIGDEIMAYKFAEWRAGRGPMDPMWADVKYFEEYYRRITPRPPIR